MSAVNFALKSAESGLLLEAPVDGYTLIWEAATSLWKFGPGGGGGAVTSVFGRTGAVIANTNDYDSDQIANHSGVTGSSVTAALNTLSAAIPTFGGISNGQALVKAGGNIVGLSGSLTNDVMQWNGTAWVAAQLTPIVTPPANPGDNGAVPIANAGDFSYVKGTVVNQVLAWNGTSWAAAAPGTTPNVSNAAAGLAPIITGTTGLALISNGTSAAWSTNFQAQNLTTQGGILLGGATTATATVAAGWLSVSGQGNSGIAYRTIAGATLVAMTFGNGATDDRVTLGTSPNASVTANLTTGRLNFAANQILSWNATLVTLVPSAIILQFGTSGVIQKGTGIVFGFPNSANQTVELWANAANMQGSDRCLAINAISTLPAAAPASGLTYLYTNKGGSAATLTQRSPNDTISALGFG